MTKPVAEQEAVKTAEVAGYKLGKFLGVGGMGTVYAASLDGQECAFKLLNPDKDLSSFKREIKASLCLDHPKIAKIYEHDLDGERPFIVREYRPDYFPLDPKQEISIENLCKVGMGVAEALIYAYSMGVIHGDVKPSNILVGPDYYIMLTDFGMARFQEGIISIESFDRINSSDAESDLFSASKSAGGTLQYLSPEQRQGKKATEQSDIYSLNSVLFEILTQNIPDVGAEKMLSRKKIPTELSDILIHGLDSLEDRYGKMEDWLRDMEKYVGVDETASLIKRMSNGVWDGGVYLGGQALEGLAFCGKAAFAMVAIGMLFFFELLAGKTTSGSYHPFG